MTREKTFAKCQQFIEKYVDMRMIIINYVDDVASNVKRG